MTEPGPDPNIRRLGWYFALAQVGVEMVVPIALGWWLDRVLGWEPWLLVVGVVLGPVIGFWHLISLLKQPPPEDGKP